jgi:hypothetical protein
MHNDRVHSITMRLCDTVRSALLLYVPAVVL